MRSDPDLDVSVVIPFADDEEYVGRLSRRIAHHLRALGLRFEILAVDEDSGDNSVAILALLRASVPELLLASAAGPGHGFATGAGLARGRTLWLVDVARADVPLGPFGWANAHIRDDRADVVWVDGRYLVCRRTRVWRALDAVRGRGAAFDRRFLRRVKARRLRIATPPRPPASCSSLHRLIDNLAPARFMGFLRTRA